MDRYTVKIKTDSHCGLQGMTGYLSEAADEVLVDREDTEVGLFTFEQCSKMLPHLAGTLLAIEYWEPYCPYDDEECEDDE